LFDGEGGEQMRDGEFEVLTASEMQAKYGLSAEHRPTISLDPTKIPVALRHLIALAEQFGIGDDLIRADVLAKIPPAEVKAMRQLVAAHTDAFDEWLAGPESKGPHFSAEYIAFSCLRMAADGC
jgi:hypothetical protein